MWAEGVFLQARMEDHGECMLVLIGATPEGRKELIGFPDERKRVVAPTGEQPTLPSFFRRIIP
jgi:hypothetical protein